MRREMVAQHVLQPQTKSNEWYTPARYVEIARKVMGSIDLDPASCVRANRTVKATKFYSKGDDGLRKPWHGNVWLNPPYSLESTHTGMEYGRNIKSVARTWIERLISEYQNGNVHQAILLVKAEPQQAWFIPLWEYPICFTYQRIIFERMGLPPAKHQFGCCFVYLGPNEAKFIDIFSEFGTIAKRVSTPRQSCVITQGLWEGVQS